MAHERLFVTKNTGLVRAALSYINRLPGLEYTDPPVLSDRAMAGTLWVASGGKGAELPLHKLLANCTAAVRPRRDVIEKVREVLRESSHEDARLFEALIEDDRCGYCLMRSTLGDSSLVTGESTPRLLREMKLAAAAEVVGEKDEQLRAEREAHTKELQELAAQREADADRAQREIRDASTRIGLAEATLKEEREQREALTRRLAASEDAQRLDQELRVRRTFQQARYVEWLAYAMVFVPIAFLLSLLSEVTGKLEGWSWLAGFGGSILLGLAQFAIFPNVLFGKFARNARLQAFRRGLERHNLGQYATTPVDWDKGELVFAGRTGNEQSA